MKKIDKMLWRDIKYYKWQFIAIIGIIFIGITLFASCVMSFKNLQTFKDNFYKENNFLDSYVTGNKITDSDLEKIKKIDGINQAEARVELEGYINLNSDDNSAYAKIIALKDRPAINKFRFTQGKYIENKNDVLVSKNFAEFHKLSVGENLSLRVYGQDLNLKIAGIIETPEFIITIKSRDYVMPSIEDFGIVYLDYDFLNEKIKLGNEYNQIHMTYKSGADSEKIKSEVENLLDKKFLFFTDRKDQISEVMAREDIGMISEIAYMFPIMFLFASSMVIVVMQKKMIDMQRTTIGVLKALGYKNSKIVAYFLKQGLILGTSGSVLAILPAYYLSIYITKVYCELVYIPISSFNFDIPVVGIAIVLSNFVALIASYFGVKVVLRINAAEAMRPAVTNKKNLEPFKSIVRKMKSDNRMVYRNLFRNPARTLFVISCYVTAFVLFSCPLFLYETVIEAEESQYEYIQNYDYKIVFNSPMQVEEVDKLIKIKGLNNSNKFIEVPVEIKTENGNKKFRLIGVSINDFKLNDGKQEYSIKNEGVILPKSIADSLKIKDNQDISIKLLSQKDKMLKSKLNETFDQYVGFSGYVNIAELEDILNVKNLVNGVYINISETDFDESRKQIEDHINVKRIDSVKQERAEFKTLLKLVNVFISVMILFGILMGFASVYNATMINVIDRRREWGTLKVLGYTNSKIVKMNVKEVFWSYLISIIPSVAISSGVCYVLGILMSNEFYTSPFVLDANMFIYPAILVFIVASVSTIIYYSNIKGIKTYEVIKIKE